MPRIKLDDDELALLCEALRTEHSMELNAAPNVDDADHDYLDCVEELRDRLARPLPADPNQDEFTFDDSITPRC